MRNATRLLIGVALAGGAATMALAQTGGPPAAPPGSGNSAAMSNANRDAITGYNHVVASGDLQAKKDDGSRRHSAPVPATAADIKPGTVLRDIKGVRIGTIASLESDRAIVDTGQSKIGVPLIGFGKDDQGLLLNMTAEKFNQLVAAAHAASQAQSPVAN
jgi:hypothetical protein